MKSKKKVIGIVLIVAAFAMVIVLASVGRIEHKKTVAYLNEYGKQIGGKTIKKIVDASGNMTLYTFHEGVPRYNRPKTIIFDDGTSIPVPERGAVSCTENWDDFRGYGVEVHPYQGSTNIYVPREQGDLLRAETAEKEKIYIARGHVEEEN